jgi:hypothetical protein
MAPISRGGARFDLTNGQGACKPCHARKTAIEDSNFTRSKGRGRSNLQEFEAGNPLPAVRTARSTGVAVRSPSSAGFPRRKDATRRRLRL